MRYPQIAQKLVQRRREFVDRFTGFERGC